MIGGYDGGAENAVFAGSIGAQASLVCAPRPPAIKKQQTRYDEKA